MIVRRHEEMKGGRLRRRGIQI